MHEHGIGANALSAAGGSAVVTSTFPLASDDDRAQALEHKLRQVEMELRKYKVLFELRKVVTEADLVVGGEMDGKAPTST